MLQNPFMLREIVGESGQVWIVDVSPHNIAGSGTNRGTPHHGWRKGTDQTPTVWIVRHWIYQPEEGDGQQGHRDHLNRTYDYAQHEGILGSPFFLQVLDRASAFQPEDTLYVVSELADRTLGKAMNAGPLRPDEIDEIERRVGAALVVLHGQSLIHSDVTPANIFKIGDEWKLGDLGAVVERGQPIRELPRDRRYVPDDFDFDVPADPELDRGCLANIISALRKQSAC
jgi:serine/threonine protein kinase